MVLNEPDFDTFDWADPLSRAGAYRALLSDEEQRGMEPLPTVVVGDPVWRAGQRCIEQGVVVSIEQVGPLGGDLIAPNARGVYVRVVAAFDRAVAFSQAKESKFFYTEAKAQRALAARLTQDIRDAEREIDKLVNLKASAEAGRAPLMVYDGQSLTAISVTLPVATEPLGAST